MINKRLIPDELANFLIRKFDDQLTRYYPQYAKTKAKQRKLEKALTAGKAAQRATLPKGRPKFEGYDIYWQFNPYYQVGGDYFDFMEHNDERLGISIGDVSGKGLEAALTSHSIHAALDVTSRFNNNGDISNVMMSLNNFLTEHTDPSTFATLIYGELTREGFRYCNAGHNYPLLFMNGLITPIEGSNLVLGVESDYIYSERSFELNSGDVVFLYSDGVIEALESNGLREVYEVLQKTGDQDSKTISNGIHDVLRTYKKKDDQTTIVVKKL